MPVELSNALKNTYGLTMSSGMMTLFSNKVYTTFILTVITLILIMSLYPCKKETPAWVVGKLGLYIFITSLIILIIHDGVIYNNYKKIGGDMNASDFIDGIHDNPNTAFKNDNVTVTPTTSINQTTGGSDYMEYTDTNGGNDNDSIFKQFGV